MESVSFNESSNATRDQLGYENENVMELIFKFYVEGVGILTVGSLGLIINILALYILFRKKVRNPFYHKKIIKSCM